MKKENQLLSWIDKLQIGLYLQPKSQQKPKTGPNSKQRKIKKQKKVKSDCREVQIIENGSRDAEENTERKRGPLKISMMLRIISIDSNSLCGLVELICYHIFVFLIRNQK